MTIGKGVGEGGNAAIGVDCEKKGLLLGVLGYVDFMGFVGDSSKYISETSCERATACEKGNRAWT